MKLTYNEYNLLRIAVEDAAAWRGTLVGNPDPEPLRHFDARIAATKQVLKKIREQRKQA